MSSMKYVITAALLIGATFSAANAQSTSQPDPIIGALRDGSAYLRDMITKAADQMPAEDYAFKPTPDVRTLGQLFAHIADSNFFFCSAAKGEKAPAGGIEKKAASKAEIQKQLIQSFDYCDAVYANASNEADRTVEFMGKGRAPAVVLTFRNYHGLMHYGNVITYMRLRGKVPPSSQIPEMK